MPPKKKSKFDENENNNNRLLKYGYVSNYGLPLPVEILLVIFGKYLGNDRNTLTICCRTSRSLFNVVSPILYRRIGISPYQKRDSRLDLSLEKLSNFSSSSMMTPTRNKSNINSKSRKSKLLKFATHLRIDAHDPLTMLNHSKIYDFPNLKVLTLCLTINNQGPTLHTQTFSTFNLQATNQRKSDNKQCSLLNNILIKANHGNGIEKLIIDGSNMTNIIGYPQGFPSRIYDTIRELTFICPSINYLPEPLFGGFPDFNNSPLKKVNWIFYTENKSCSWKLGRIPLNVDITDNDFVQPNIPQYQYNRDLGKFIDELWSFSNFILQFPATIQINIVNSGKIQPQVLNLLPMQVQFQSIFSPEEIERAEEESTQDHFANQIKQHMIQIVQTKSNFSNQNSGNSRQQWYIMAFAGNSQKGQLEPEAIVEERWKNINWTGMKDYLENNYWEGELEPKEVEAWLT
ncbi:uncharacterized protein L201_001826 [Kwoniella dendrophila CBS 6074]|uniref:F-box domain-containing protein n=1 Tax=Kwoniella dendrophila CBS 6074 TaxID=1295534 RepID=A0AAX4JQY5_9TREE